jgi:hypothetical protein
MIDNDIPNAFPFTEPKVRPDPRFKHDDCELLNARPMTVLSDANAALEVCVRVKEHINAAKSILGSFFPTRIENAVFLTEVRDKFSADIENLNGFAENIEKIQNLLIRGKSASLSRTLDRKSLEKLRNHIIRLGYDAKVMGKKLVEVFPNIIAMKDTSDASALPERSEGNLNNSNADKLMCKLSKRLIDSLEDEDQR